MLYHSHKPGVLVIDDDLDTLDLLRTALSRGGYEVSTASCWEEVTDRLNLAAANKSSFSAIILDLMMPDRSGYDIFNSLEVILEKVPPVIVLSARCGVQDMIRASDMGAAKYLVKPTSPEKLLETLGEVISNPKG